jgi:hypothetical protein
MIVGAVGRWADRLGVVAAVVSFVGFGAVSALHQVPFRTTDESAHLGYAHEVADWRLPAITSAPDVPVAAVQWRAERASAPDDRYRGVWVANHPPLPYVAAAPLVWISNATGRPDGGLLLMRFLNVVTAAVGVALTFLLGRELSGGVGWVGVVAASLVAFLPQGHAVFAQGLTDGMAFAAATFVAWAAVVCLQRGATARRVGLLALATTVAFGARAVTMVLAVVVVGFVACVQLVTSSEHRGRRERMRAAVGVAVAGVGPAAVIWGWFYARNRQLYGDVGASGFLLDRFDRVARGSWFEILTWGHLWADLHRALLWRTPPITNVRAPLAATTLTATAAVGLVVVVVTRRSTTRAASTARGEVARSALVVVALVVGSVVVLTAQHVAGGGGRYARYLLPSAGALAALVAPGLSRLLPRVLPMLTMGLLGIHAVRNLPPGDVAAVRRPRDHGPMPSVLQVLPSTPLARSAAVVLLTVGLIGVVIACVVRLGRAAPPDDGARTPPPTDDEVRADADGPSLSST